MKTKDIAIIVAIVLFSGVLSFFISGVFFSSSKQRTAQVEVVEPISAEFPKPDEKYFNKDSIDPTQLIRIGDSANPQPFNQ